MLYKKIIKLIIIYSSQSLERNLHWSPVITPSLLVVLHRVSYSMIRKVMWYGHEWISTDLETKAYKSHNCFCPLTIFVTDILSDLLVRFCCIFMTPKEVKLHISSWVWYQIKFSLYTCYIIGFIGSFKQALPIITIFLRTFWRQPPPAMLRRLARCQTSAENLVDNEIFEVWAHSESFGLRILVLCCWSNFVIIFTFWWNLKSQVTGYFNTFGEG